MYKEYKAQAIILVVYISEAHPATAKQTVEDAGWKKIDDVVFYQPKTFAERRKLAEKACTFWELPIPSLVDTIKPSAGQLYESHPNRIYVIDKTGKIVHRGPRGPWGVNLREGEVALRDLLGLPQENYVSPENMRGGGRGQRRAPAKSK